MREVKAIKDQRSRFCSIWNILQHDRAGKAIHYREKSISSIRIVFPELVWEVSGFSPIAVRKDERIIKAAEYHTTTWEGIVALDDDMIIHVAPASGGVPVPELAKAFIVPKGCMVKINAAIWHLCPLPLNNEELHAMIILPECTYANDCTVVDFEEKDWFKITV